MKMTLLSAVLLLPSLALAQAPEAKPSDKKNAPMGNEHSVRCAELDKQIAEHQKKGKLGAFKLAELKNERARLRCPVVEPAGDKTTGAKDAANEKEKAARTAKCHQIEAGLKTAQPAQKAALEKEFAVLRCSQLLK